MKPIRDKEIIATEPRPKSTLWLFRFSVYFIVFVLTAALHDIFHTPLARYGLFVLKVLLNANQPASLFRFYSFLQVSFGRVSYRSFKWEIFEIACARYCYMPCHLLFLSSNRANQSTERVAVSVQCFTVLKTQRAFTSTSPHPSVTQTSPWQRLCARFPAAWPRRLTKILPSNKSYKNATAESFESWLHTLKFKPKPTGTARFTDARTDWRELKETATSLTSPRWWWWWWRRRL